MLQSYGDTWTSQLFVLADFANVSASGPEVGRGVHRQQGASTRRSPALDGFQHTAEIYQQGLMNKDYASLTNVNGAQGARHRAAAQYPMLSAVIGNVLQIEPRAR